MKRKSLITTLLLVFSIAISGCISLIGNKIKEDSKVVEATSNTVTMRDIATFLESKNEHYPLSDEFIEKYQQDGGGYIDNARKAGLVVDKQLHEPNQKWHFFESWLYPSIEDGSLEWEESAKSRVYSKLLCPELLLWIYEACEVDPNKVREAKEVAEQGKVNKTSVSTIAKNMRGVVAWDDLEKTLLNYVGQTESYKVKVEAPNEVTVKGLNEEYYSGSKVTFTASISDSTKQVDTVKVNGTVITGNNGTYSFTMGKQETTIVITIKEKEIVEGGDNEDPESGSEVITPPVDADSVKYTISYDLGSRTTAKLIESQEDILATLIKTGDDNIITSIGEFEFIYGGGNGGSGETKWYSNDLLKFGTTTKKGTLTLNLNTEVDSITITGYIHKANCSIRVGDSASLDWNGSSDGKTTLMSSLNMNVADKDVVGNKQTKSITVNFEKTKSIKIATNVTTPIYISSIEFHCVKQGNEA